MDCRSYSIRTFRNVHLPIAFAIGIALTTVTPIALADEIIEEDDITEADRDHWAFRPIRQPKVPKIENDSWSLNAIDRFILRKLKGQGLSPSDRADPHVLVRRLYLNLIGLPPPPEELERFENQSVPHEFDLDVVVDRLLSSPQFGERWGQHWLDLARFAETDGFEHDKIRPDAWQYRDWIIKAINHDMPYDQFVKFQIAGDLIDGADPIATAFCLSGPDMPDINLQTERKHTLLNELTSTVGATLLGLQVGCAQCHNHMYDPISQADFYRLRAFFQNSVHVKKNKSISVLNRDKKREDQDHVMVRGDFRRKGPQVKPSFLRIANEAKLGVINDRPARLQFAEWLVDRRNPLTARVIVNRIWRHHFGRGLSTTPSDFGVMGDEPSHPDLLDWLAAELISSDWSQKRLHRMIVTSATYQQQSDRSSDNDNFHPSSYNKYPRRRLDAEVIRDSMLAIAGALSLENGGPGVRPALPVEMKSTLLKNQWNLTGNASDGYRRSIYIFARRNLRFPLFAAFDRPSANCTCDQRVTSTTAPQSLMLMNSEFSLEMARRLAGRAIAYPDPSDRIQFIFEQAYGRRANQKEVQSLGQFIKRQSTLLEAEKRHPKQLATPIAGQSDAPVRLPPHETAAWTDLCLVVLNSNEFLFVE